MNDGIPRGKSRTRSVRTIDERPISALRPYAGNARTHSKRQIRQLMDSITRFGFTNPVLVGDDDIIVAGHGRVVAAERLGMTHLPTVRLSHLTEAERRAYVIADNKLALNAGWDPDLLAIELQTLIDLDFEVELTGFLLAEVDLVLDSASEREETLVPDAMLQKIEKVDGPEPEDDRPIGERFPPGTWIERDSLGTGVVIATDDDALTVLLANRMVTISVRGDDPVVWKLDRPSLDLTLPREQRRIWWWWNAALCRGQRPCPCCGYPNLGIGDEFGLEPVQCIVCGWTDEWDGAEDADEVRPVPDPDNPLDWEWPNWGYSLTEARGNFEKRGVMFRPGDPRAKALAKAAPLR